MIPSELNKVIADFEARRTDAQQFEANLADFCAQLEGDSPDTGLPPELLERIQQLAARVEMMRFNLCRAERRGAILELLADFRVSA